MVQDAHEITEAQVADFATPQLLHSPEIQVLEKEIGVFLAQFVGDLEMPSGRVYWQYAHAPLPSAA